MSADNQPTDAIGQRWPDAGETAPTNPASLSGASRPARVLNAQEIEAIDDFVSEGWSATDIRTEPELAEVVLEYLRDLLFTIAIREGR